MLSRTESVLGAVICLLRWWWWGAYSISEIGGSFESSGSIYICIFRASYIL